MSTTILNKLEEKVKKKTINNAMLLMKDQNCTSGSPQKKTFYKQATKQSDRNNKVNKGEKQDLKEESTAELETKQLLVKQPYYFNRSMSNTNIHVSPNIKVCESNKVQRIDHYGKPIIKKGKGHKVTFIDQIKAGNLEDIVEIKKLSYENNTILSNKNSSKDASAIYDSRGESESKDQKSNDNCSCLCNIF